MTNEEFLQYLKETPMVSDDKKYISSFFNKKKYIDTLNKTAMNLINDGSSLASSSGNYNAKIAILIENYNDFSSVQKFAEFVFSYMHTSLWNVYITFYKKSDTIDKSVLFDMLLHELGAVEPKIVIHFSNKESFTEEELTTPSSKIKTVNLNIDDVKYVLDKDSFKSERYVSFMEKVYNFIATLIPLREVEILE